MCVMGSTLVFAPLTWISHFIFMTLTVQTIYFTIHVFQFMFFKKKSEKIHDDCDNSQGFRGFRTGRRSELEFDILDCPKSPD